MKLHELKPAEGARKERKRVGRGMASQAHGKTSVEDIKVKKLVPVVVYVLDLKVDKCLYSNVCRNVDLQILIAKNMPLLILIH